MNLPFTALDLLVILVILGSAGYAAWKGFLSETLTIFDWLAAAFGCLYFGPYLVPMARGMVSTGWLASLLAYAVVFLIIFIPLSFMSHRFSESVKHSPIGPLDRALGIAFGVVRGLAVVALVYLAYSYFVPVPRQADWVKSARTLPMIQSTGMVILSLVPAHARSDFASGSATAEPGPSNDAIGDLIRDKNTAPAEPETQPSPAKKAEKGYGANDRRALDNLLQNGGGSGR